jgi:hypothetical protein
LEGLRLISSIVGDEKLELRLAKQLVATRGDWFDFHWLGSLQQRRGRRAAARVWLLEAQSRCSPDDPDRDQLVAALAALGEL